MPLSHISTRQLSTRCVKVSWYRGTYHLVITLSYTHIKAYLHQGTPSNTLSHSYSYGIIDARCCFGFSLHACLSLHRTPQPPTRCQDSLHRHAGTDAHTRGGDGAQRPRCARDQQDAGGRGQREDYINDSSWAHA